MDGTKMSIKNIILLLALSSLLYAAQNDDKSFQEYKNKESAKYNKYKTEIEKEFEDYKKSLDKEFKAYEKEVGVYWDEPELDKPSKWTTYSKDKKTRTIVDFEKGEVRVQTQVKDIKQVASIFKKEIDRTITIDKKEAYKRDELNQRIEKKLLNIKSIKKESIKSEPILADIFFEKEIPSEQDKQKLVKKILKKSKTSFKTTPKSDKKYAEIVFSLPAKKDTKTKLPKYLSKKAIPLIPYANKYAKNEKIPTPLVMAIIHSESSFNPMARSRVPAYGLMQIVPVSAGKDASKYLTGKMQLLSPSHLYNKENNIQTGSAYLHILYYRYLKKIKDPQSRLYCTIAAYNTGAGNVAKAFTGSTSIYKAAIKINSYTPNEVYKILIKNLPYDETKHYLKKVSSRMSLYEAI